MTAAPNTLSDLIIPFVSNSPLEISDSESVALDNVTTVRELVQDLYVLTTHRQHHSKRHGKLGLSRKPLTASSSHKEPQEPTQGLSASQRRPQQDQQNQGHLINRCTVWATIRYPTEHSVHAAVKMCRSKHIPLPHSRIPWEDIFATLEKVSRYMSPYILKNW